ncbi:MAG: 3-isopropylmalate dehydratase large subunit [bacterium]|nr:3-isopropylmalate dehydratase large subunit [bacterium]
MGRSIIDKIWDDHVVISREGHPAIFAIDLMLMHEVTSAQAFLMLEERGLEIADRGRLAATLDHSIPTRKNRLEIFDPSAREQVATLRRNALSHKVPIFDFDSGYQGVVHVIGPELGLTQPGMTIVCGDSHTSTHGAFGAMAFGVGTSEVGHVLASGCILQRKPRTMKVEFKGHFASGVYAKDAILKLIAEIGIGGANGHIVEYTGDAIRRMSMEERMTVCNMSIECGARAGIISPDETTYAYIRGRRYAPLDEKWGEALCHWSSYVSDPDATYDKTIVIDVAKLEPMVTWGTNPEQAIGINERVPTVSSLPVTHQQVARKALDYTRLTEGANIAGTPVQWAFVGSCTNGRIEDLRIVAEVLRGRHVSPDVTFYIVPGSEAVRAQAIEEGLESVFVEAGADFRMPGCSMCLGMNDDKVPAGQRCISSSNRNFVGRQGEGSFTHLASPATVAASAICGVITPVTKLQECE